jgi:hypothetical protein
VISQAILVIDILNVLVKTIDCYLCLPLPSILLQILSSNNLQSLTQALILENQDLTRVLLTFFGENFTNHYLLQKLLENGIVEFLVLCLDSPKQNGTRALSILKKLDEVSQDYNSKFSIQDLEV